MKERGTHAWNVTTRQKQNEVLINTSRQYTMERNIYPGYVLHKSTSSTKAQILYGINAVLSQKLSYIEECTLHQSMN